MCRIAGYLGHTANRTVTKILRGLLVAEEMKNPHGTGIVVRNRKNHDAKLMKKGIRGRSFLVRGYADFLQETCFNMAFLHVRYMTTGEKSDRCSHPFGFRVHGQWHFGMHNGVFTESLCKSIAKEFGCSLAKVDSETFFWALQALQNRGKTLGEAIKMLSEFIGNQGAYAFAYMTQDSVYLWRSDTRPLSVFDLRCTGKGNLGRWFCSTPEMFKKGLNIAGFDTLQYSGFDVKPYRLYRVGHKTSPAMEVETVCALPEPPPPVKEPSLLFHDEYFTEDEQQDTLWWKSCPPENNRATKEIFYNLPAGLTNSELNRKISEVSDICNSHEYPSIDDSQYLSELLWERSRRKLADSKKISQNLRGGKHDATL